MNCFNGDCSVKNLTPYRFFKDFHPRTFNEFQNYYRKRFLIEIQKPKETSKLESLDHFDFDDLPEESFKDQILSLIEEFSPTGDDDQDLKNFKELVTKIKQINEKAFLEFKRMISL